MGGPKATLGETHFGKIPNLKGTVGTHNNSMSNIDGTLFRAGQYGSSAGLSGVGSFPNIAYFDASKYNSVFDDNYGFVLPSCVIVGGYIIKYI